MAFVPPTWFEGMLIWLFYLIGIPAIIGGGAAIVVAAISERYDRWENGVATFTIVGLIVLCIMLPASAVLWHTQYEVPSVQEKVITVAEWQPKPGLNYGEGYMVIDNAADLLLVTTEGEGFLNEENFLFQKFNTRDIFNQLKVNGTYRIKYFGWREGYTSTFPCILSVEEVIDESNASNNSYSDYYGIKMAIN